MNIDRLRCRQSACGGLAIIECLVVFLLRTCVNSMGDYECKKGCLYESETFVADSKFILHGFEGAFILPGPFRYW